MGERLSLYALVVREGFRRLVAGLRKAAIGVWPMPVRAPERLLVAPQDLRTSDPTVAGDIYAGYFVFAGRLVEAKGRSPFTIVPPSVAWAEALMGFSWLRHLRAADSAIARANGRAMVDDFLRHEGDRRGIGAEPRIVARRLISFLSQAPLVLEGADRAFYLRFMRALGRSVTQLRRAILARSAEEDRLLVAIALAYAGLCLHDPQRLQARVNALLSDALAAHILADGGHISRNPRRLTELLSELLPLRQTYAARGIEPPIALLTAIDRMMPMLRLFRHGDGELALFNGMGVSAPDLLATLLAYDDARAQPLEHAPTSGYERLTASGTLMLVDVGKPPPRPFSRETHAGCLSFELSAARCHLVVNCGAAAAERPTAQLAARSTAAHSTLVVNDASSCHFAGEGTGDALGERLGRWLGPVVLSGPTRVEAHRGVDEAGQTLVASHDGYLRRFGIVHERRLVLADNGERLDGADRLLATTSRPLSFALRFHLHPSVRASRSQDGRKIMLLLPDGEAWSFEAPGYNPDLDESVYFAAAEGPRRTEQIVVAVEREPVDEIIWRFARLGRHQPRQRA
ncbi:heparinase II/III family protein [Chelatococcus reniformis]|uniref:Heparinase n=1 Tax=Chelatococcus reniformis TaxID=1494448 RepID=A0A916TXJ9_9HYPH|nr:heparinase II/III family protein [Chelatococcus reniformis]GGC50433.1 heparinase [Chelatococcus reniformis]